MIPESYAIVSTRAESWEGWATRTVHRGRVSGVMQTPATVVKRLDGRMMIVSWRGDEPPEVAAIRAQNATIYTGREGAAELAALINADPAWTPPQEPE